MAQGVDVVVHALPVDGPTALHGGRGKTRFAQMKVDGQAGRIDF